MIKRKSNDFESASANMNVAVRKQGDEMKQKMHRKFYTRLATCVALTCVAISGFALSQRGLPLSLEQMTREADEVVWGTVVDQNTRIVANSFETDYEIQVHENLKNGRNSRLVQGRSFTLTLPGGAIKEPPLTQYVMGSPYMYKGEEVLLFLRNPTGKVSNLPERARSAGQESALGTTYKVVGLNQGRFSVVTREDTGERLVTRANPENFGLTASSAEMQETMRAISRRQIPTVMQQIVRSKDIAAEARKKDPLEFTSTDGRTVQVEKRAGQADAIKANRASRVIPVQEFQQFKSQIENFARNSN